MKKALAILLLACLAYVAYSETHITAQAQVKSFSASHILAGNVQSVPSDYDVIGNPTITPDHINAILCSAGSPACHTGEDLYSEGVKAGIDPIYALAFFQHESSYGKYGVARATLGLGNIRCTPGYSCIEGYRAYASWDAGYKDWYALILYYVNVWHKRTLPDIIRTYAPSSENDTNGYITAVERAVETWRGEQ